MSQTKEHGVAVYKVFHYHWPVSIYWSGETNYFESIEDAALWMAKETGLVE